MKITSAVVACSIFASASSLAQDRAYRATEYVIVDPWPDTPLLVFGSAMLFSSLFPSHIVALASSNPSDQFLWIPIAGPWLDLADRGHGQVTTTSVLLITDGLVQAASALVIAMGLVPPITRVQAPNVHFTPTGVAGTF